VLSGIFYLWTILAKSGGVPRQSLNARRSKSFPPTIRCRLFLSDQIRVYLRAEWLGVSDLRVATPARIVIADACTVLTTWSLAGIWDLAADSALHFRRKYLGRIGAYCMLSIGRIRPMLQ
jgi:hypothetical protein